MSLRWITARPWCGVGAGKLAGNSVRIGLFAAALGLAWLARDPTITTAGLFGFISLPWGSDDSEEPTETDATNTAADGEETAADSAPATDEISATEQPAATADTGVTITEQPTAATTDGGEVVPNQDEGAEELEAFCAELTDAMAEGADGDLTVRMDPSDAPAGATEAAEMFNELIEEFSDTVQTVDDFSDQVTGATNRVTGRVEEVKSASKDMSSEVNAIADDASKQNSQLEELSDEIRSLSAADRKSVV